MTEAPTLFERLALAQISDDLAPRPDELISDLDRVTALGFAPVLGSYLLRLKGGHDAACYKPVIDLLMMRLHWMGKRQKWSPGINDGRYKRVAEESIRLYLQDWCNTCGGRGEIEKVYIAGQEHKEGAGEICRPCGGTGKAAKSLQARAGAIFKDGDIPQRLEAMLDAADAIVARAVLQATGISRSKLYGRC